jgi:hypothetical protein
LAVEGEVIALMQERAMPANRLSRAWPVPTKTAVFNAKWNDNRMSRSAVRTMTYFKGISKNAVVPAQRVLLGL